MKRENNLIRMEFLFLEVALTAVSMNDVIRFIRVPQSDPGSMKNANVFRWNLKILISLFAITVFAGYIFIPDSSQLK